MGDGFLNLSMKPLYIPLKSYLTSMYSTQKETLVAPTLLLLSCHEVCDMYGSNPQLVLRLETAPEADGIVHATPV
jgi:hypothetical protein